MPSQAPTVQTLYGVLKAEDVTRFIYSQTAPHQIELQRAIDGLSVEPRPEGASSIPMGRDGLTSLFVKDARPTVILLYDVDDANRRVHVLSIMPARFQG